MLQVGMISGFAFFAGLLWGLDDKLDIIIPFALFSAIIFVAVNLLFDKSAPAPPKY